jgi:hypothetical protein
MEVIKHQKFHISDLIVYFIMQNMDKDNHEITRSTNTLENQELIQSLQGKEDEI